MSVTNEIVAVDHAYTHVLQRQLVTSVGVAPQLLQSLTNHDVACLLTYSGTLEDMSKWVVADLLVWGEEQAAAEVGSRSGKAFWDARDTLWDQLLAACKLDISKHTAYNMAATARAFGWERRRHTETLSFEHHRLLTSRSDDEQAYWLDMAEAGGWSVARLRQSIYGNVPPLMSNMTVLPRIELWPIEDVERQVYRAFEAPSRYDTIEQVKQLILQIKGDYQHAIEEISHKRYPRPEAH